MIENQFDKAIFIDDAQEHLDTVFNKNVNCFFADWGYGQKNKKYKLFEKNYWELITGEKY